MQPVFPKLLSSRIAFDIARTMLDGFDKRYGLFREASRNASATSSKATGSPHIAFYDYGEIEYLTDYCSARFPRRRERH